MNCYAGGYLGSKGRGEREGTKGKGREQHAEIVPRCILRISSSLLSMIRAPSPFIAFIVNLNRHRDALFIYERERENEVLAEPNGAYIGQHYVASFALRHWRTQNFAMKELKCLHQ